MAPKVRGYILDLTNNEGQIFAQNPQQFEETYEAIYETRGALAAPHQRRQFKETANPKLPIEVTFNRQIIAMLTRQLKSYDETLIRRAMKRAKGFFASLASPRRHPGTVLLQAPPTVLVVWPKTLRIRATMDTCTFSNTDFAEADGSLVEFTAAMAFTEDRDRELYSDDIRRLGSLRG